MIVTFIYGILGMFNIAPSITQNSVIQIIDQILMILTMLGVVIDPTTKGIDDSNRAMNYEEPWSDESLKDDVGSM